MQELIRRIITGMDESSNSKIISDELIPATFAPEQLPNFKLTELFYTEDQKQTFATEHKQQAYAMELPVGAFRFCVMQLPPLTELVNYAIHRDIPVPKEEKDYLLHKTNSVDYIYILKGEVVLRLENGEEKSLKAGDFVVQKGAVHAWNNHSNEPCEMLAVIIGVNPNE